MRVLVFFVNDYDYGDFLRGGERRFLDISIRLKELGVELYALEYEHSHSEKLGSLGYSPITYRKRCSNTIINAFHAMLMGLISCLRLRCDIIYVPSFSWGGGKWVGLVAPYIVSLFVRKPLVIIFHHLQHWDFEEKNPITLRAYSKAACIAVSKATANDVKRAFQVRNVYVIGNGINQDPYKKTTVRKKEYDAVFLGRIEENKGIFVLLRAWKKVIEIKPNSILLIIGPIRKEVEKVFYRTIEKLNIKDNVIVTGFIPEEKKIAYLKSSNIFVLPSQREGFGLAVFEAMAADLPCIIPDIPAFKEYFSEFAILVPPLDVERLVDEIVRLLNDTEKREMLIEKGKHLVNQYSWEKVAKKEYKVLKRLLKKNYLK